jgi:hypothetical protein
VHNEVDLEIGTSKCGGNEKAATICSGYKLGDDVAGTYSVAAVTKHETPHAIVSGSKGGF